MKKLKYILMTMLTAVAAGCVDSGLPEGYTPAVEAHYLEASKTEFSFSSSPSSDALQISSTQSWAFSGYDSWLKVTPSSGEGSVSVDLSVEENLSGDESRMTIFSLTSSDEGWQFSKTMNASQAAAKPYINVSEVNVTLSGAAQQKTLNITSNTAWTASCVQDWVSISPSDDRSTLLVSVSENLSDQPRTATLTLMGSTTVTVNITQNVSRISSETSSLSFPQAGAVYAMKITSETAWTASTTSSWSEISPSSGAAGTTEVKVSASTNTTMSERSGYVLLKVGGVSFVSIPITQEPIKLSSESKVTFAALGETKGIPVSSNIAWTVLSKPSWLTLDVSSGKGDATIQAAVPDNENSTSRSGEIELGVDGFSYTAIIKVEQDAKYLSLGSSVLQFSDKASTKKLPINTNGIWNALTENPWISLASSTGTCSADLGVSVTENTATTERIGQLSVSVNSLQQSVTVQQEGKYCVVDNGQKQFTSKGGTLSVKCSTNDSWTAKMIGGASWIKMSTTSGDSDAEITLTATDNASVNDRVDTLLITPRYSQAVKVVVRQAARYLKVDANGVEFFSKGGTSSPVNIDTDGKFKISSSTSWLTTSLNGTSLTLTATKNPEEKIRYGSVIITLTDLVEGEMSLAVKVIQYSEKDGLFGRDDFGNDADWDDGFNSSFTVNLGGYSDDGNWDDKGGHSLVISIVGYSGDRNWDPSGNSGITVTRVGYKGDQDWDEKSGNGGSFGRDDFGGDSNLDNDKVEK